MTTAQESLAHALIVKACLPQHLDDNQSTATYAVTDGAIIGIIQKVIVNSRLGGVSIIDASCDDSDGHRDLREHIKNLDEDCKYLLVKLACANDGFCTDDECRRGIPELLDNFDRPMHVIIAGYDDGGNSFDSTCRRFNSSNQLVCGNLTPSRRQVLADRISNYQAELAMFVPEPVDPEPEPELTTKPKPELPAGIDVRLIEALYKLSTSQIDALLKSAADC